MFKSLFKFQHIMELENELDKLQTTLGTLAVNWIPKGND